ncbi:nitroreductase family deazaflavin-dependent oxidoreductase [Calidifontibacter terrae]
MSTNAKRPPAGAQRFNKVAIKAAGTRLAPLWAVVEHRGRTSGQAYETPVAIVASTDEVLYIGLPWGVGTDWVRNLRAAGGGTLRWRGKTFPVTEPTIAGPDEARSATGPVQRLATSGWKLDHYLRLRRGV